MLDWSFSFIFRFFLVLSGCALRIQRVENKLPSTELRLNIYSISEALIFWINFEKWTLAKQNIVTVTSSWSVRCLTIGCWVWAILSVWIWHHTKSVSLSPSPLPWVLYRFYDPRTTPHNWKGWTFKTANCSLSLSDRGLFVISFWFGLLKWLLHCTVSSAGYLRR